MTIAELFAKLGIDFDAKGFKKADEWLTSLKDKLVSLATSRAWGFIKSSLEEITSGADNVVKESQKLGVGIEELQELGYAADQSGSSLSGVSGALKIFSRKLGESKKGGGEFKKTLRELGISMNQIKGESLDQNLELIAEKISKLPDGYKKSQIAQQLFGRSGTELIPLLNAGQKGIVELRNEARELGIVVGGESAKAMEEFRDDQDRLNASLKGIKTQIISALIPTLSKLLKSLLGWIKANREWLKQKIERAVKLLVKALILLGKVISMVAKSLDWLGERMGLVAIAVGSLTVAFIILKRQAIQAAIQSAIAWTAAMAPVVLWGLVIAGVLLILEDLYHAFTGGESVFKNMYLAAKHWIGDKLMRLLKGAKILVQRFLGQETDDEKEIRLMHEDADKKQDTRVVANLRQGKGFVQDLNQGLIKTLSDTMSGRLAGGPRTLRQKLDIARAVGREYIPTDSMAFKMLGKMGSMQNQTTINVTVPPGTDAHGVAGTVRKEMDGWFKQTLRTAQSGTGTGGTP